MLRFIAAVSTSNNLRRFGRWWIRLGRSKIWEAARGLNRRLVNTVADAGTFICIDQESEEGVNAVVIEPSPATRVMLFALE